MPQKINNHDKITSILKNNPLGLAISQLQLQTGIKIRTLQRLLGELREQNKIVTSGRAQKTIYKLKELLPVGYNDNFLQNLTTKIIFSEDELKQLETLGKRVGQTTDLETFNLKIFERLIIDLSWSSSFLEGNTYSLLETERLILNNEIIQGKELIETQMILNHKESIKFITYNKSKINLDPYTIKSVHALLSENLLANPEAQGALRKIAVGIEGTRYLPLDIPQKIEAEFNRYLLAMQKTKHPLVQSFITLVFLPYLQPFEDLNKRTSRVCCNIPLIQNNYVPISFLNVNREEYLDGLMQVYEFNNFETLKNIFIKSYQYSVEQYRYVKLKVVSPNPMSVKYRNEIKESVKEIVLGKTKISKLVFKNIKIDEKKEIIEIIKKELNTLHEENLIRFNLKPSEFKKWKSKTKA